MRIGAVVGPPERASPTDSLSILGGCLDILEGSRLVENLASFHGKDGRGTSAAVPGPRSLTRVGQQRRMNAGQVGQTNI
jgi:hypothetical protein